MPACTKEICRQSSNQTISSRPIASVDRPAITAAIFSFCGTAAAEAPKHTLPYHPTATACFAWCVRKAPATIAFE